MIEFEEITAGIDRDDPIILDIGANNGEQTMMFLGKFPECHVFSFEPDPRAIAKYRQRISDPRATLVEMAVGARIGTHTFYQSSGVRPDLRPEEMPLGWDQSGSIRKPAYHLVAHPWVKFETTITVEVTTLDAWAATNGISAVDFIWADVQGAEEDLIAGARNTLAATRYLYTEYSNLELYEGEISLRQILAMLPDFELVKDYGNDVLLRNKLLWNAPTGIRKAPVPETTFALQGFDNVGGLAWYCQLPGDALVGDTATFPTRSRLKLLEGDTVLGPPHSMHDEIREKGRGRYSHWHTGIYFSTPDGSDPRTNGRTYAARIPAPNARSVAGQDGGKDKI